MSIYSKDKCTKEKLAAFKTKVCGYLIANGIDLKKIKMRCQRNYDGNIKIFTYKTEFPNSRRSVRKFEDGYYRGKFETAMWMGIYFYRTEWEEYLKPENADQRNWDLADIKKREEIKKLKERAGL